MRSQLNYGYHVIENVGANLQIRPSPLIYLSESRESLWLVTDALVPYQRISVMVEVSVTNKDERVAIPFRVRQEIYHRESLFF